MDNKAKEINLILELIRFKDYDAQKISDLISKPIDFPWVLGQLLFNRVAGIAYYVLLKCDFLSRLNREFRNSLKNIYDIQKIKSEVFLEGLSLLSEYFRETNINHAFIKGSYLILYKYKLGLRTSNDYDVLIDQKDIGEISNILKENKFIQGKYNFDTKSIIPATRYEILNSRLNRGETIPFLRTFNSKMLEFIEVDINFSLDYKAKNEKNIVGEMMKSLQVFKINNNKSLTLSNEDFLIQLCVHLYKEATVYNWVSMQRDLSLYKFCDIYAFFVENNDLKYTFANKVIEYGLQEECYYSLYYTGVLFPCLLEKSNFREILREIKPRNINFLKQIINPSKNKMYEYEMDFINWLFNCNRVSHLKEL